MKKIFVIISLEGVSERIRSYIDKGFFSEAQKLSYEIEGFCDHVRSEFQKENSTIYLLITDRIILECSLEAAETVPLLVDGLRELLKGDGKIACGFGYNIEEASKAMLRSRETNQIELYDEELHKNDNYVLNLPINNGDPKVQGYQEKIKPKTKQAVSGPDAKTELQAQAEYTNAIVQTLMPQQQPAPQQQPQQQQQDPNAPQPTRKSLHELLTGTPAQGEQQQDSNQAPSGPGASPEAGEVDKDESTGGMTPEEKSELDKIGESILSIKENIPHLMDLAERNPQAFKQSVGVINKLLAIAKEKFKKTEGAFADQELLVEELNKAIQKFRYPVGTVKNRKKKQIINGKASWRSLSSGQVMDDAGNAISIKSHNVDAEPKTSVV